MKGENSKPIIAISEVSVLIALALVWLTCSVVILTYTVRKFGRKDSYLIKSVIFLGMFALFTLLSFSILLAYIIRVFYQ